MTIIQSANSYIHIAVIYGFGGVGALFWSKNPAKQINTRDPPGQILVQEKAQREKWEGAKGASGKGFHACKRETPLPS